MDTVYGRLIVGFEVGSNNFDGIFQDSPNQLNPVDGGSNQNVAIVAYLLDRNFL